MQGFVDVHHHLLYGLDDGPRTLEDSKRMLHKAVNEGVACLVATPHIQPGMTEFDMEQYRRSLYELQQYACTSGLPVTVLPGAEIYYTTMTPAMLQRGSVPHLGGGYYVLVEFHPHVSFDGICRAAVHIANAGCAMVLAHAERYRCLRVSSRLETLRNEYHIRIQLNCRTILEPGNFLMRRWVQRVMEQEWVDLVASDAHDMVYRPCLMGQCAAYIEKKWGRARAEKLCCTEGRILLKR